MPIYTKESLETLRHKIDLVEVLDSHIELKKAGAAYKALCPFHDEKTASFMVQRGDQHYHCFGCGAHGDAIHFLMSYQKLSFTEAVEYLSAKFQVPLEQADVERESKGPPRVKLKEALNAASRLYHFALLHTELGLEALNYLYSRGITLDFIRRFSIGFSPSDPGVLKALAQEKEFSQEILYAAGLITGIKGGAFKDFFSDRIMFPIQDATSSVIGFSARKYREETFGGKYINTPETALFKKSKVLFGLNFSRRAIAKERKAIIVEGQIDALSLIYAGFDIAVAGQGTAFGEGHIQELLNLGIALVYLALDSDEAGLNAALKIGDLFQKAGVEVRVILLPKGYDPDLYLRKKGSDAFLRLMEESVDYLSFLVAQKKLSYDVHSPAGKNELVKEIVKQIHSWDHQVMVHESLRKLASLMQIPEEMIGLKGQHIPNILLKRSASAGFVEVDSDRILEVDLLRWLILMGDAPIIKALALKNISSGDFLVPLCRKVFEVYQKKGPEKAPLDLLSLALELEEGDGELFLNEVSQKKVNREKAEAQFVETIQRILDRNWMIRRERIKNEIQSGQLEEDKVLELVKEFDLIKKAPPKVKYE